MKQRNTTWQHVPKSTGDEGWQDVLQGTTVLYLIKRDGFADFFLGD